MDSGVLERQTGITCPFCSQKLRVLDRGSAVCFALLGLLMAVAIAAARPYNLPHDVVMALAVPLVVVLLVLPYLMPFLATLRVAEQGEKLDYPLDAKSAGQIQPAIELRRRLGEVPQTLSIHTQRKQTLLRPGVIAAILIALCALGLLWTGVVVY
jgi:hypothetical protein